MSVIIEPYDNGQPFGIACQIRRCHKRATHHISAPGTTITRYVCSTYECQKAGVDEIKQFVALTSNNDEVSTSSRKRHQPEPEDAIPWSLEGVDQSDLEKYSAATLERECAARGLPKSGTKGQRANRLIDWKYRGGGGEIREKTPERKRECPGVLQDGRSCHAICASGWPTCKRHYHQYLKLKDEGVISSYSEYRGLVTREWMIRTTRPSL